MSRVVKVRIDATVELADEDAYGDVSIEDAIALDMTNDPAAFVLDQLQDMTVTVLP